MLKRLNTYSFTIEVPLPISYFKRFVNTWRFKTSGNETEPHKHGWPKCEPD